MELEEEVVGMDLQKKRRSHHIHMMAKIYSPTNSESSITSESSASDTSFDINSANVDVDVDVDVVTNGENPTIVQHLSEVYNEIVAVPDAEEDEKDGNFEEPINGESGIHVGNFENENENENEETNGFSVHQNGADVAHLSSESDEGDEDVRVGSNGTTFSTGPDTAVGLKYVESLLDESSTSVDGKLSDITTAEQNIVNKILKSGQNELGLEAAEYDVEGVLLKQETHDLYCPYCNQCITKRVILRRKRKRQDISTDEEIISSGPGQIPAGSGRDHDEIVETSPENGVGQNEGAGNGSVDALTCFSCLKIFIPTGKGFLCWKFGSDPDTDLQPESPRDIPHQAEPSEVEALSGNTVTNASIDEDTGKLFPMWFLNCCQPYRDETKTDEPVKSDTLVPPESEPPTPPGADGLSTKPQQDIPPPTEDVPAVNTLTGAPNNGGWQRTDGLSIKPPQDIPPPTEDVPAIDTLTNEPNNGGWQSADGLSTKPAQDIPPPTEDVPAVNTLTNAPNNGVTEKTFPLWILTCCQPYRDDNKLDQTGKTDVPPPPNSVPFIPSDDGTPVPPENKPVPPHIDTFVPPKLDAVTPSSSDPKPGIAPDDDEPDIKVKLLIYPGQRPGNKLTVIPPDDPPPTTDPFEKLEGQPPGNLPNPGVSGLDVIKAIVYGGLLETIASLSIISSAAGGDATTLNIVALGLANVFGGLIVLFHNLRELKNDPIPEHYEERLGRRGHFLLHATIAFISYLVFGLMAPVIYGFSFRKSDDKNLKLITLAAASFVCITILSTAKAYVQPPKNYFKTIFEYATIGVMVSGLGYVSGELINDALKKLSVFDSRSPVNMSVLETGAVKVALSSY